MGPPDEEAGGQSVVYLHSGTLLSTRKDQINDTTNGSPEHSVKRKKPDSKSSLYGGRNRITGGQGPGDRAELTPEQQGEFGAGDGTIPYLDCVKWLHDYSHLSKRAEPYPKKDAFSCLSYIPLKRKQRKETWAWEIIWKSSAAVESPESPASLESVSDRNTSIYPARVH